MRTPAALALVALSFAARTTEAEPCAPRAELTGDAAAVAKVRGELSRIGVATGAGGACRTVHARVQPAEHGGLAVSVVDRSGRSEGREVSDAALAAAWIDSWLHDDLEVVAGGGVAGDGPAAPAAPAVAAVVTARAERSADRPDLGQSTPRSVLERGALSAGYEQSLTGTTVGSSWEGGSVAACAMLGPVCVGARVHYAHQPPTQSAITSNTVERSETVVLATASVAFKLGPVAIVPELGIGAGRFWEQGSQMCVAPASGIACLPTDPTCSSCPVGQSTVSRAVTGYAPRGSAALRISVAMFAHVWLDASASVIASPTAHSGLYEDPTAVSAGPTSPTSITLPGEPQASVAFGLGVRVGMP